MAAVLYLRQTPAAAAALAGFSDECAVLLQMLDKLENIAGGLSGIREVLERE
ncbi:hypothetical protein [Hymenobacter algoricola]|uniref:Uncharacterized protein n=1 Tax=Hymenobacter algoricola TaxID=486267 RepID=A0ABP7NS75_9BACT